MAETRKMSPDERKQLDEMYGRFEGDPNKLDTPGELEVATLVEIAGAAPDEAAEVHRRMDALEKEIAADQEASQEAIEDQRELAMEEAEGVEGGDIGNQEGEYDVSDQKEDTDKKDGLLKRIQNKIGSTTSSVASPVYKALFTATIPVWYVLKNAYKTVETLFKNNLSISGKELKEIWRTSTEKKK